MRQTSEENSDFYNAWAKTYDEDINSTIYIDELYFHKFWGNLNNKKALEIGCGSGRNTQKLVQANHNIIAIDISKSMLEKAKLKTINHYVNFICGDYIKLEISDNDFDFAIISLVLEHIEDLNKVFAKVFANLKNGASLFISEIHPQRMQNGSGARFIDKESNVEIRAKSFVHNEQDFENAAKMVGFEMIQKSIFFGTSNLANIHQEWAKYNCKPMILVYEFIKP